MNINIKSGMIKAEEIEILNKLHVGFKALGEGDSYLGSLFSKKLVDYATVQIQNDVCPDIMDSWAYDQSEASKKIFEISTEVASLREAVRIRGERIDTLNGIIEKLTAQNEENLQDAERRFQSVVSERAALTEKFMAVCCTREEQGDTIETLTAQNEELKYQIVQLKAKMYDMITGK